MNKIKWNKQHCGVIQTTYDQLITHMPDLACIVDTFPEDVYDFTWCVKVHVLMPGEYPCSPHWHYDTVPSFDSVQDAPMYLWMSDSPLTEFKDGRIVQPASWVRFTQQDEHRGTISNVAQWRGFIRASHKNHLPANMSGLGTLRRHSQVYLDVGNLS